MLRRTAAVAALILALSPALAACGGADEEPTSTPPTSSTTPSVSPTAPHTGTPTTPTAPPDTGTPPRPPEPTATPTTQPTSGLAQSGGWQYGSCRPQPGEVLLQYPFRAVRLTRIEDIGVYPGSVRVMGAWVTPAGKGVPDLVSAVDWPEGFAAESKATYRWAERKEAVEEVLPRGRYHLFVLVEIDERTTIEGLDIAWVAADGDETGALQLDHEVTVGKCG